MLIHVSSASELEAAYQAASDGDKIVLAAGNYEATVLSGKDFASGIVITSEDPDNPAVFTDTLDINSSSGVILSYVNFVADSLGESAQAERLGVLNSSNITLSNIEIQSYIPTEDEAPAGEDATVRLDPIAGYGYDVGLRVRDSSDVTVESVEIHDARIAAVFNGVEDATVSDLYIHDVREGINLVDIDTMVIEDSVFTAFTPWKVDDESIPDDHPDMIQYWADGSDTGLHHITIQNNLFYQPEGYLPTQTIFGNMSAADDGVYASHFTVTGNTIINSRRHGISLVDVKYSEITNNILVPMADMVDNDDYTDGEAPRISILGGRFATITGNTVAPFPNGTLASLSDTEMVRSGSSATSNTLLSTDPSDPNHWGAYTAALIVDADAIVAALESDGSVVDDTVSSDSDLSYQDLLGLVVAVDPLMTMGSALSDTLIANTNGSLLVGLDGDDWLYTRPGSDTLIGGDGADKFVIDTRKGNAIGSLDVITDFNFDDGDWMQIYTYASGAFSNDTDPDNAMFVSADGSSAIIDSLYDLNELYAAGEILLTSTSAGMLMTLTAVPGQSVLFWTLDVNSVGQITQRTDDIPDLVFGTDGNEVLSAVKSPLSVVFAGAGNDTVRDVAGDSDLYGQDGADKFVLDMRKDLASSIDRLVDIDFAEGDWIQVLASADSFPSSEVLGYDRMYISSDGSLMNIDSVEDILALAAAGIVSIAESDNGAAVLTFDDVAANRMFELTSIAYDELVF